MSGELTVVWSEQVRAARELVRARGEANVHPAVRRVAELDYQDAVFRVFQRLQPVSAVLRREWRVQPWLLADVVLDSGERTVVCEVRGSIVRPVDVQGAAAFRVAVRRSEDHDVRVLVVSPGPYEPVVIDVARSLDVDLVVWREPEDDVNLDAALSWLRAGTGSGSNQFDFGQELPL